MTNTNPTIKTELLSEDYRHVSRDLGLIFDSIRDIHYLSNEDGLMLGNFSSILNMVIEKMVSAFGHIESNLLMYEFSRLVREATTDEEKLSVIKEYEAASESLPIREYAL